MNCECYKVGRVCKSKWEECAGAWGHLRSKREVGVQGAGSACTVSVGRRAAWTVGAGPGAEHA